MSVLVASPFFAVNSKLFWKPGRVQGA
jgi:hypothetical protein